MTPSAMHDIASAAAAVAANAIATADDGHSTIDSSSNGAAADTPESAPTAPSTATASKSRQRSSNLTHEQKRLICLHAKQHPTLTQAQLGHWAKERFELAAPPSQSSISHTLKRKHSLEHMKSEELASKRMRSVKFPELDVALANWFLYCQARQMKLQGDEIKAKALLFFEMMPGIHTAAPPQFSNGWLHSFQSRHGFTRSPNNTLGGDLPPITTRSELFNALEGVAPWDVYWMDETSLQFTMSPDRDVATEQSGGDALVKKMTLALCTNADGSDMVDPFFVCPGPLENTGSASFGFQYAHNRSAWMSPTVFREWLLALDWKMHEENRHILLLLDSTSSHQVKKMALKNVSVRFVASSGSSSHLLFAGESLLASVEKDIFTAVKRRYRHVFLDHVLDRRDERQADIYDVDPLQAVQWVIRCWRDVPKALIVQSFVNIGIAVETGGTEADFAQGEEKLDAQITALLKRLKLKSPMKLEEFLSPAVEFVADEELSDQDFVDSALNAAVSVVVVGSEGEGPRRATRSRSAKKPGAGSSVAVGTKNGSVVSAERQSQQQLVTPARASTSVLDSSLQQQQQHREQTGDASSSSTSASASAIADEEWQNWANSHRVKSASADFQALQRVIRLATEMNCETSTMLDLNRMLLEVAQTQALALPLQQDPSRDESQQPQPTGVCRFTFGPPTKQHVV